MGFSGKPVSVPGIYYGGGRTIASACAAGCARIDGKVIERQPNKDKPPTDLFDAGALGRMLRGNTHLAQTLATGLDAATEHTLEIEPVFTDDTDEELRIESICVAGGKAGVTPAPSGKE